MEITCPLLEMWRVVCLLRDSRCSFDIFVTPLGGCWSLQLVKCGWGGIDQVLVSLSLPSRGNVFRSKT